MCLKTSQSQNTYQSKFIFYLILFSLFTMDNREQQHIQSVANIVNQQPINPVEPHKQSSKSTLDQRIEQMQATAALARVLGQARKSAPSVPQVNSTTIQKTKSSTTHIPNSPTTKEPTTSQAISKNNETTNLPILQLPKKSTMPFMQRFRAYHASSQKSEYRKIASIPCGQQENKSISLYLFKDKDRAYKAAGELRLLYHGPRQNEYH